MHLYSIGAYGIGFRVLGSERERSTYIYIYVHTYIHIYIYICLLFIHVHTCIYARGIHKTPDSEQYAVHNGIMETHSRKKTNG